MRILLLYSLTIDCNISLLLDNKNENNKIPVRITFER